MTERERAGRRIWGGGVGLALTAAVTGFIIIALARWTDVPGRPWAYIGVAIGLAGAASLIVLGMMKAKHEAEVPHDPPA